MQDWTIKARVAVVTKMVVVFKTVAVVVVVVVDIRRTAEFHAWAI